MEKKQSIIKNLFQRDKNTQEEIIEDYLEYKKPVDPAALQFKEQAERETGRRRHRKLRKDAHLIDRENEKINEDAQRAADEEDRIREEKELEEMQQYKTEKELEEMHRCETEKEVQLAEGLAVGVVSVEVIKGLKDKDPKLNQKQQEKAAAQKEEFPYQKSMLKMLEKSEKDHMLSAPKKKITKHKHKHKHKTKDKEFLPLAR